MYNCISVMLVSRKGQNMQFREWRTGRAAEEEAQPPVTLKDGTALVEHCRKLLRWNFPANALSVRLCDEKPDDLIEWDSAYAVAVDGKIIGFTDSPY